MCSDPVWWIDQADRLAQLVERWTSYGGRGFESHTGILGASFFPSLIQMFKTFHSLDVVEIQHGKSCQSLHHKT